MITLLLLKMYLDIKRRIVESHRWNTWLITINYKEYLEYMCR